jgi:hypothetical protein
LRPRRRQARQAEHEKENERLMSQVGHCPATQNFPISFQPYFIPRSASTFGFASSTASS